MSKINTAPNYELAKNQLVQQLTEMLPVEQFQVFKEDAAQLVKDFPNPLVIKVGEIAPKFSLPNAIGEMVHSKDLSKKGPLVLVFYRGAWCPYCNLYLNQLQQVLSTIEAKGATLVAISPQNADQTLSLKEKNELKFQVLSDVGNQVAKQFTAVFKYGDLPVEAMTKLGYDFDSFYADKSREIPVPATFVIQKNGTVSFAKSEGGDYRNRVEPLEIINSL